MGALKDVEEGLDEIGFGALTPGTATSVFDPGDVLGTRSGAQAKKAAKDAAEEQEAANRTNIQESARQFDITESRLQEAQQFAREQQQPFQQAGVSALQQQQALLGLSGQEAQQQAFAELEQSPGQKFLQERAQRNLLRNASAIGGLGGGNVRSALVQQGVGFGQQDIQNQFGRLGQLSGRGQQAGASLGQGELSSAGQLGQFGAQSIGQQGAFRQAGAEARASGILGVQQAGAQQVQGRNETAGSIIGLIACDSRLKTDIEELYRDEIGGMYHFRYHNKPTVYKGRMAQELLETRPDAVIMHESGFLHVTEEFRPEVVQCH
jgi:hypothetical protein